MTDSRQKYQGLDVAWLAVDACDHVAVFTTAGVGPIPESALESVELTETLVRRLPVLGGHRLLVATPRPDDFIDVAARGLFAYDWQDLHRTMAQERRMYDLMALPASPIVVSALPTELRELAQRTRLDARFGDVDVPAPVA